MDKNIIIDECFNCKKKKDIGDNWRTCKLKCSYKYKRKENDYITRLEQETKELKETINTLKADKRQIYLTARKDIDELKQENKELKEEISKLGKKHEDYCNTMYWQMKEQMDKYRSALEEIRENLVKLKTNDEDDFTYEYSKIEDKINEVLQ